MASIPSSDDQWCVVSVDNRSGRGLVDRSVRALRLDPTLYQEVAASRGGTWQAGVVVLLAAVGTGLGESTRVLLTRLSNPTVAERPGILWQLAAEAAIPIAVLVALVHVVAWPVWAAAIWMVGRRLTSPGESAPGLGSFARALAFAQAPGALLIATPIVVRALFPIVGFVAGPDADSGRWVVLSQSVPRALDVGLRTFVSTWVLLGTFLAVRDVFGLSHGRAVGAIVATGVATALVVGVIATTIHVAGPAPPWAFGPGYVRGDAFGVGGAGVSIAIQPALPVILGFDFNLGLIDAFLRVFIHTWP